jgi:hypothetical protein
MTSSTGDDTVRQAASDSVRQGEDVRERIRNLTLEALMSRRFDRNAIRDTVRVVSEGLSRGAEGAGEGAQHSLAEAIRGMDQALTRAVDAGQAAIRQLVGTGRGLSEHELKQALAGLQKIEDDFIDTVNQVAESASERVRPDLKEAVSRATGAGTETGRKTLAAMTEFATTLAGTSVELTLAGIELAGTLGVRFAKIASGMLAGAADALDKGASDTKKSA